MVVDETAGLREEEADSDANGPRPHRERCIVQGASEFWEAGRVGVEDRGHAQTREASATALREPRRRDAAGC